MSIFTDTQNNSNSTTSFPDILKFPSACEGWCNIKPSSQEEVEPIPQPPCIPSEYAITEREELQGEPVIVGIKNRYPQEHSLQYVAPSPIFPQIDLHTVRANNESVSTLFLPAVLENASFIFSPVDESGHLLCFVFRRQGGDRTSIHLTVNEFYKRGSLVRRMCLSGLSPLSKMPNARMDELIKAYVCSNMAYYHAITLPGWHRTPVQKWAYALPDENNLLIQQPLRNKVLRANRAFPFEKMQECIELQNGYLKDHSKLTLLHLLQTAAIYQGILACYGLKWDRLVYIIMPYLDNQAEQFFQSVFAIYQTPGIIPLPISKKKLLDYIGEANDQVLLFKIIKMPQGQYAQKLLVENIDTIHQQMAQQAGHHPNLRNHYIPIILSEGPLDRISPDGQILLALEEAELGTPIMPLPPMAAGKLLSQISFFERNCTDIEGIMEFVTQNPRCTGMYATCRLILEISQRIDILWQHMHNPAQTPESWDSHMSEWLDSFFARQEEALDPYAAADYFISILKEWMLAGKISVIDSTVPYPKGKELISIHRNNFLYFKQPVLQKILKKLNLATSHLSLLRELELQGLLFTDPNSGRKTYERKMYYTKPDGSPCCQERFYVFRTEQLFPDGEPKPF